MPDNIISIIKKGAVEAYEESKPVAVVYGEILEVKPLKISVDQKLVLGEKQMIIRRGLKEREINILSDIDTENSLDGSDYEHKHKVSKDKKIKIGEILSVGDCVLLLRIQGGQKFVILDILDKVGEV